MTDDWRDSFRRLKDELRALHESNVKLFHGVVLSLDRTPDEVAKVVDTLEPAYGGEELVQTVTIPTSDCACHQHLFFAPSHSQLDSFGRKLQSLDDWFCQAPSGLLPDIRIPHLGNQIEWNTVRWACLLYNLAWEYNEHYLQAELEYMDVLDTFPFLPWIECPQPQGCDPRPTMISHGDASKRIPEWRAKFAKAELRFPDLVSAYLLDDVISSSLSGIDILIHQAWEDFSGQPTERDRKRAPAQKTKKKVVPSKKGRSRRNNARIDRLMLEAGLRAYHFSGGGDPVLVPAKQRQLAELLDWSQAKVSRLMKRRFQKGGMDEYKDVFRRKREKGFLKKLEDGSFDVDGIVEDYLSEDDDEDGDLAGEPA